MGRVLYEVRIAVYTLEKHSVRQRLVPFGRALRSETEDRVKANVGGGVCSHCGDKEVHPSLSLSHGVERLARPIARPRSVWHTTGDPVQLGPLPSIRALYSFMFEHAHTVWVRPSEQAEASKQASKPACRLFIPSGFSAEIERHSAKSLRSSLSHRATREYKFAKSISTMCCTWHHQENLATTPSNREHTSSFICFMNTSEYREFSTISKFSIFLRAALSTSAGIEPASRPLLSFDSFPTQPRNLLTKSPMNQTSSQLAIKL